MQSLNDQIHIEKLSLDEIDKAAQLLSDSFITNPAYSLLFNKHKYKIRRGLLWLFRTNLFLLNRRRIVTRVVKNTKTGEIIGLFSMIPPEGIKNSLKDYCQINLIRFIIEFGWGTVWRMLDMDSFNKKQLKDSIHVPEYYYLSMVAVKEGYRGRGIGSFMIQSCILELKTPKTRCHIVGLTTQLPENVTFYSRLGFQKQSEGKVWYKGQCYYNCNMTIYV